MHFFIAILFSLLSFSLHADENINDPAYAYEAGYYWGVGTSTTKVGSSVGEVAQLLCDNAGAYCSTFGIITYGSGYKVTLYKSSGSSYDSSVVIKRSCSSGITLATCLPDFDQPQDQELCSDGFPPDVYGYTDYCDRPSPKLCDNGQYVQASQLCSSETAVCVDYDSCYEYSESQAGCSSSSTYFSFEYISPDNFQFSCSDIDPNSPDHPDQGGNGDGNDTNDPTTPSDDETPIYPDLPSADEFSGVFSQVLDSLSDIYTAIVNGNANINENGTKISDSIDQSAYDLGNRIDAVTDKISQGISIERYNTEQLSDNVSQTGVNLSNAISQGSEDIVDAIQGINAAPADSETSTDYSSKLDEISGKLDELKPCDPDSSPTQCEGDHGLNSGFITSLLDSTEEYIDEESGSAVDTVKAEISSIVDGLSPLNDSALDGVFDTLLSVIPSPQSCIPLTLGTPGQVFSFTISCEFSDQFKKIFSFLLTFYTVITLIEILTTGIPPRLKA
ncbi:YhgE/Pip domain-containing protein [Marinomonas gallaica]|uniref:hypothetical protein n=1 Tax=Marinomonas gallaica TaxID=1806667 RepID=UPI00082E13C7|nr:hypothetical protein [Marinomonas gallaica]